MVEVKGKEVLISLMDQAKPPLSPSPRFPGRPGDSSVVSPLLKAFRYRRLQF